MASFVVGQDGEVKIEQSVADYRECSRGWFSDAPTSLPSDLPIAVTLLYNNCVPLLPLFPLELVLFPGAPLPLHIFEPRYREMIAECLEQKRAFGMVRVKENTLSPVGCSATILNVTKKYEDGRLDIEAEGRQRFEIVQLNQ